MLFFCHQDWGQSEVKIPSDGQRTRGLWKTGAFRGFVVVMPVELPEGLEFHEFGVAIVEDDVDGARERLTDRPWGRIGSGAVALQRNGDDSHALEPGGGWSGGVDV